MPVPPWKRKRKCRNSKENQHPYVVKLNIKIGKPNTLLNQIYELADNDLLLSNAETGLNDYSINDKFVKKLDNTSKLVAGFANQLSEKALEIQDKVDQARDRKHIAGGILFVEEVTNPKRKCPEMKKHPRVKFIPSTDFRIKVETISDSESDHEQDPVSGELDGKFTYPKDNENAPEVHSFHCDQCPGIFRDQNELQNHYTNHKIVFYTCLVCDKILRSIRSFEVHRQSHAALHTCDICSKMFTLKTSLTNHAAVHSTEQMHCSHGGCNRAFKHRANMLEHIKWGHRDKKECPCNVCGKLFQMPTNMCSHRVNMHGYVPELIPGHPHAAQAQKRHEELAFQKAELQKIKQQEKEAKKRDKKRKLTSQSDVKALTSTAV